MFFHTRRFSAVCLKATSPLHVAIRWEEGGICTGLGYSCHSRIAQRPINTIRMELGTIIFELDLFLFWCMTNLQIKMSDYILTFIQLQHFIGFFTHGILDVCLKQLKTICSSVFRNKPPAPWTCSSSVVFICWYICWWQFFVLPLDGNVLFFQAHTHIHEFLNCCPMSGTFVCCFFMRWVSNTRCTRSLVVVATRASAFRVIITARGNRMN